jgi:cell division protein FtsI/penicillin-binding protein 2
MSTFRVRIIYFFCFAYFFILLSRLFFLQVIEGAEYQAKSEKQRQGQAEIPAERGLIFASDDYVLAQNQISYVLNFDKNLKGNIKFRVSKEKINQMTDFLISDKNIFSSETIVSSEKIAERKKTTVKYISNILNDDKRKAGVIYKKLSSETKNKIEKLNIDNLYFTSESLRRYPESSMSAHLIGFLGRDENDELKGYFGLEGYYDQELKGASGTKIYEKDPLGRPILLNLYEKQDAINGRSLQTSIDRSASRILDKWIEWGVKTYDAKSGTAILYDPFSGDVAALSIYPTYDPNNYYLSSDVSKRNIAISDVYEPGSIMKPLVISAALNEGLINSETKCPKCSGPREMSGYLIKTYDDTYKSNLTIKEVLERSDNTGMTYVGELLGKKMLLKYFSNLGFGQLSKIDLEGETSGFVKEAKDIYDIDQATMTFGQGISVNSIQMVKAWGSIVTGKTYRPKVVNAFISDNGKSVVAPIVEKQIFSNKVLNQIKDMLVGVTNNGELHFARDKIPGLEKYQIAAKSGTAQIPVNGKYAKDITLGSVIGFAPAENPKYILFVKLDEAKVNQWGANTAGAVFFNIWNDLFQYYNIPPN